MIRTLGGQEHKDVSTLRKGDVFHTNRNGTLPWSPWFIAKENPKYKIYIAIPLRKSAGEYCHAQLNTNRVKEV